MLRRNWLDLGRKRVDRFDLDFTLNSINAKFQQEALSLFGAGVLITNKYPSPFPVTLSSSALSGTIGTGIAYDSNGEIIQNDSSALAFTIGAAHATLGRWDLLILRYRQVGAIPIPKPSDPILTVNLNLTDTFDLVVIPGTAAASPAYPSKVFTTDVVLAGIRIPAAATTGAVCTVDVAVRESAYIDGGTF